jgi:hypothetical protein
MIEYKLWPRNPDYRVGNDGSIWTKYHSTNKKIGRRFIYDTWRMRATTLSRLGYERLNLLVNGKWTQCRVHAVVLETFVGPRPEGMECRHLNDIKTDNRAENLCWGTKTENHEDQRYNKGYVDISGSRNPKAKIRIEDVKLLKSGRDFTLEEKKEIARRNNITLQSIYKIIRGETWNDEKNYFICNSIN